MRTVLRASSARLIVGHLDPDGAAELLSTIESRGAPLTFALAEPEGLRVAAAVPAGMLIDAQPEPVRWGKLVLETVANEAIESARKDFCDAVVDALGEAHRRLGPDGLDLIPRGSSGVGFCAAVMMDGGVQLVIVPPAQVFVVHQGSALCVPESASAGRGIWVRDDLRAEMFAGIGGAHEPDIRVYDAAIGPGDTLVLASSDLGRMLTEDDVRLAVTYEDAATGAERIKQLAIQRGVEAGVALVVEISGTLEREQPSPLSSPIGLSGLPKRPLKLDMPPIGSIFSTARDWLLEAVERVQPAGEEAHPILASAELDEEEDDVGWPSRPAPGHWREILEQDLRSVHHSGAKREASSEDADVPAPKTNVASSSGFAIGWRQFARRGGGVDASSTSKSRGSIAIGRGSMIGADAGARRANAAGRGGAAMAGSLRQMSAGADALSAGLQRVRGLAGAGGGALVRRIST